MAGTTDRIGTIKQAFSKFKSNLEISDLQAETVSTRQRTVRKVVEAGLTVHDSFITGSYCRSTLIAPLAEADVDIFFVLDAEYYEKGGQAALLDKVKRVLQKKYSTPVLSRNGQAVTISFSDFQVDVVPAFNRQGRGYLIPNTQGGTWIETNPKKHERLSSENNRKHDGNLVPLEKMIKCWNREINRHFRSFHLEVLAWEIFDGVTIPSFAAGTRYFFDKGRAVIKKKNPDPAGYSGDVGYYLNTQEKVDAAVSRFETAYKRAVKAEEYEGKGNIASAIEEWRKIFGDYFPAYG